MYVKMLQGQMQGQKSSMPFAGVPGRECLLTSWLLGKLHDAGRETHIALCSKKKGFVQQHMCLTYFCHAP